VCVRRRDEDAGERGFAPKERAPGPRACLEQVVDPVATNATNTGPVAERGARRCGEVARAGALPGEQRETLSTGSAAAASRPRKRNSSAGHAARPWLFGAPSYAEHAWKLVPPKPKALTTGATRLALRPGAGGVANTKGLVFGVVVRVRRLTCSVGGQHAVVERERGLDEAREPGGALGVADLRLHRAERARPRRGRPRPTNTSVSVASSVRSPDDRAGAVGLDEADLGGRHARAA
jgi:hypothetical protein